MNDVAENSSNTLGANGGKPADGIPADGTGREQLLSLYCLENFTDVFQGVLQIDPWLSPFQDALKRRYSRAKDWITKIDETEGGLHKFSKACSSRL